MPVIIVYGFPDGVSEKNINNFKTRLKKSVNENRKLKLADSQVSVFLPKEHHGNKTIIIPESGWPDVDDLIIFVHGIFNTSELQHKARKNLAINLVEEAKKFFPQAYIECFINTFDLTAGFYGRK